MKILYVTTIGGTMAFFESVINELIREGNQVDIATNEADSPVPECYDKMGCKKYQISCSRSPLSKNNLKAIKELRKIVKENGYNIVHCHTPIAAACTRIACRQLRKKGLKVFYTSHGFHFYTGAPAKNWMIYYPIEWICSYWTDVMFTINREDYERAKKRFHAGRTEYVPGVGIRTERFINHQGDGSIRKELNIGPKEVLLASVGEVNENKNHCVVIKAMKLLKNNHVHYAIAGTGPLEGYLKELAKAEGIENQVHLLGFRKDVPELYAEADICLFTSIREGLGLAAVEGMACGLPLIVSDNRGTRGFLTEENAITCRYDDAEAFAGAIRKLMDDKPLREAMGKANVRKSRQFDVSIINKQMLEVYHGDKPAG